ncbi:MAG: C45 family peptidase [Desulfobacterales bacterium]|nr:C45 family peptidase [Desulfobacterales bacterium]
MKRTLSFLPVLLLALSLTAACMHVPDNTLPLDQRSMVIDSPADADRILSKARMVESDDPALNHIKVLYLSGTPYEMGFQHGRLNYAGVRANVKHIVGLAKYYAQEDIMDEVYDLISPYIPLEEKEEMRGLAHGANLPLRVIHWLHCIPEVSEFGPKERLSKKFESTFCSNIAAFGKATADGELYQMRVLDWIRQLGAHKHPVILVHQPDQGNASATFSFAGFIGCVSGINEKHMAFGEMGYGDPENERLDGIPFVFLFRKLMREADTLAEATDMIQSARRTCSYVYMISDAKATTGAGKASLFVTDPSRVLIFKENMRLVDERNPEDIYPAIDDVVYGGAKPEVLYDQLTAHYGRIDVDRLKDIAKPAALKGNMQNVIFKPQTLETWVSYAAASQKGKEGRACNQKWFYFNFGSALD